MLKTLAFGLALLVLFLGIGTMIGVQIHTPPGETVRVSQVLTANYLVTVCIISLVYLGGMLAFAYAEKRQWNGGVCRETGGEWQHFDTDSQGGRGYKSGDRTIWISYPVDVRR